MKTLTDFKRALEVGSKWEAFACKDDLRHSLGIRKVGSIQSNAVAFDVGNGKASWLYFPKASEFEVSECGEIRVYWPERIDEHFPEPRRLAVAYRKID